MFQSFYNMAFNPFSKSLPAKDAYPFTDLSQISNRLDHLCFVGGIGCISAEVGFGKTFCTKYWASNQNPNTVKVVYLHLTSVSVKEFYAYLCEKLGLIKSYRKTEMFSSLQNHIQTLRDEKHIRTVIFIDEAHYLSLPLLTDLVMLTNFDMDSRDCLSLVLVGGPSLIYTLRRQPAEALRSRITINYTLGGLKEDEAKDYLTTQLRLSGADPSLFDDEALMCAYQACGRSIRRFNAIITASLMVGAQASSPHIDTDMVLSAIEEITLGA